MGRVAVGHISGKPTFKIIFLHTAVHIPGTKWCLNMGLATVVMMGWWAIYLGPTVSSLLVQMEFAGGGSLSPGDRRFCKTLMTITLNCSANALQRKETFCRSPGCHLWIRQAEWEKRNLCRPIFEGDQAANAEHVIWT